MLSGQVAALWMTAGVRVSKHQVGEKVQVAAWGGVNAFGPWTGQDSRGSQQMGDITHLNCWSGTDYHYYFWGVFSEVPLWLPAGAVLPCGGGGRWGEGGYVWLCGWEENDRSNTGDNNCYYFFVIIIVIIIIINDYFYYCQYHNDEQSRLTV